tara:strand:- start:504 stop:1064 length:561 start_codon:yes stop_codon:yes gene_type:complete
MAGKLRYAISVTPMETVIEHFGYTESEETDILTNAATRSVDVIMTEVQETLGCSSADFTIGTTALVAGTNGYEDGVGHIRTAPKSATAVVLPSLTACDALYLENTGFEQDANGVKETAVVNTTDYLVVATAATSGVIVASLKANEGVFLPLRGTGTAQQFFIRSALLDGTTIGSQGTLGCKFLSVT